MAGEDDGPNFSYAFGDAPSWNPALRPDHESPRKPSFARVDTEHSSIPQAQDDDELPVAAPPVQDISSSAFMSHAHMTDNVPASDDDFFDRYGHPEVVPAVPAAAPITLPEKDITSAHTDDAWRTAHVKNAGAPWENEDVAARANGTRQEDVQAIAARHTSEPEHDVGREPASSHGQQPAKHVYEHQGETTGLEEAVQESSEAPLVATDDPVEEGWGASNEWQIGAQERLQPAVGSAQDAFNFDADDRDVADLATKEPEQPDVAAAVFSTDEATLSSQDAHFAADTARTVDQVPVPDSVHAKPEPEPTAVPQAAQESSQNEWGTSGASAFDFDAPPQEEFLADLKSTAGTEVKATSTEQLADAWADVAGDEDFLMEDAANAFGFDVDDDEGFLNEATIEPASANQAVKNRHSRATSVSKYTPANVPQSGLPPPSRTASYRPDAPNFVDLSKPQQQPAATQRAAPASPYISAYQQPAQRPPLSSAESFADKAKGGYHSPYDLPDDLTIKRRRPVAHPQASASAVVQAGPPPRLSSMQSMPSMRPPNQPSPIASGFPGPSPAPPRDQFRAASTAAQPSESPNHSSGFFADLPVTPRLPRQGTPARVYSPQPAAQAAPPSLGPPAPIRPASTSYAPQQAPSQSQLPTDQSGFPQLRLAERMPLYSDDAQAQQRSTTMPPPAGTRYSPAVPAATRSNYSPAPPAPAAAATSRYSPAPGAKPTSGTSARQPNDIPPGPTRSQAQLYAPRTSSPLAQHSLPSHDRYSVTTPPSETQPPPPPRASLTRIGSIASISGLETVNENAEPTLSPPARPDAPRHAPPPSSTNSTPPPPKSLPSSGVSSPRKRTNYAPASYQPMITPGDQPMVPPKRPQTSSPSAAIKSPHVPVASLDRPASVAALQNPVRASFVKQPNRIVSSSLGGPAYHEMGNLVQPRDESSQDPLQRWKGAPVFRWGNGNSVVMTFPRFTPMYGSTSMGPTIKPTPGEIKTGIVNTVCPQSDIFLKFPGPLKRGKKKEVLAWLRASIDQLEAEHKTASMNGELTTAMHTRSEERILLWRIMTLLVEHDGTLEGNSTVETAVRALITASLPDPVSATDEAESSRANVQPEAFDPQAVKTMRSHLYAGEREKAVWHAVDQRLWAHALLIASTLNDKEIWKQVVQEFVRKEVRKIGDNTEALAALYQVFAGNWEESIDELVSVSARSGFQMVSTASGGAAQKDALAGLDKWRETLLLVLNNRSAGDAAALASLGNLLNGYGRVEAGHICFLFARSNAIFGGADDQQSHFSLVGGNASQQGSDFGHSLDTILLSEVYEFAMISSSTPSIPFPHLQSYKLYHAEALAEAGKRTEAQQYCDAITSIVTTKANRSPYYNAQFLRWLDDFSRRLSQAPADKNESSWKPSMDKVSSSIWGKFNNFIAGESDNPENIPSTNGITDSFGPMSVQAPVQITPQMPPLGRTVSSSDMYGGHQPNGHTVSTSPANAYSRYAPGNTAFTPRSASEQQGPKHTPQSQPAFEPRATMEPNNGLHESRSSNDYGMISPQLAGAPSSSHSAGSQYTPSSQQAVRTPTAYAPEGLGLQSGSPYVPSPSQHATSEVHPQSPAYLPTPPMEQQHSMNGYAPEPADKLIASFDDESQQPSYQPDTTGYGYEPPTSTYEPTPYQPYQPNDVPAETQSDEVVPQPKKKSFMDDDDDDDDIAARAASLKKSQKSEADRQADEAFRKAAEADAAKAVAEKSGPGNRASWFGGWFGKKQDPNAPVVHKAKLGEESSFYFDKELGRWVNKKAGSDAATPVAATPPPPKSSGPPSRPASAMMRPPPIPSPAKPDSPASMASGAPTGTPTSAGGPPQRSVSAQPPHAGPVAALTGGPPSRPPSRPSTSMSNASDIDDLLGPAAPRKAGAKKASARKGRYVDVMANKS